MAPRKRYESKAEKQKAYRDRKTKAFLERVVKPLEREIFFGSSGDLSKFKGPDPK